MKGKPLQKKKKKRLKSVAANESKRGRAVS